ncbi:hypothetical protein SAMD00019534_027550 [Acytostelium subglobosum LB1]|uniref:hypothetical protein n=1 Tax=Acytostelium subglobosum LB1 TaxID=1410327 RepID=UPI000644B115|nr:hypothetical protein SAMD00019534_027550 [Acytostelium subglobosum LB1]GAM19580.1 hypothetical protein SAMD00019534_027550 [Acytostelium subglobosum LB1]|eukprot:XP_012757507.1 hypothetical protein SAMD00019534_027550 [Acytostelium subglobosum LB1]
MLDDYASYRNDLVGNQQQQQQQQQLKKRKLDDNTKQQQQQQQQSSRQQYQNNQTIQSSITSIPDTTSTTSTTTTTTTTTTTPASGKSLGGVSKRKTSTPKKLSTMMAKAPESLGGADLGNIIQTDFGKSFEELLRNPHIQEKIADHINSALALPQHNATPANGDNVYQSNSNNVDAPIQMNTSMPSSTMMDTSSLYHIGDVSLDLDNIISSIESDPEIGGFVQQHLHHQYGLFDYHPIQQQQQLQPMMTNTPYLNDLYGNEPNINKTTTDIEVDNIVDVKSFSDGIRSNPNKLVSTLPPQDNNNLDRNNNNNNNAIPDNIDDFLSTLNYHDDD